MHPFITRLLLNIPLSGSGRSCFVIFPLNLIRSRSSSLMLESQVYFCTVLRVLNFFGTVFARPSHCLPSTRKFHTQMNRLSTVLACSNLQSGSHHPPIVFLPSYFFQRNNLKIRSSQKTDTALGKTPKEITPGGVAIPWKEEDIHVFLPFEHPACFSINCQHIQVLLYNYLT